MNNGRIVYVKRCVMCASDIPEKAKICPKCNTYQLNWMRKLRKILSTISAISVVLGVITISVSLFPAALKVLFYKDVIDIHDLRFSSSGIGFHVNFINKGDGDVFVNSVQFIPEDLNKFPIRGKQLLVNEWVKEGEVHLYAKNPKKTYWKPISQDEFHEYVQEFGDEYNNKYKECFSLHVVDPEFQENGILPFIYEPIPLETSILFSSVKGKTLDSMKPSRKFMGQILYFDAPNMGIIQCKKPK